MAELCNGIQIIAIAVQLLVLGLIPTNGIADIEINFGNAVTVESWMIENGLDGEALDGCQLEMTVCIGSPSLSSGCDYFGPHTFTVMNFTKENDLNTTTPSDYDTSGKSVAFTVLNYSGVFNMVAVLMMVRNGNESRTIDRFQQIVNQCRTLDNINSQMEVRGELAPEKNMLMVGVHVQCVLNFYGDDCNVHCVPVDVDSKGHYSCANLTGNKVCLSGWESPAVNCLVYEDDCLNVVCANGGSCVDYFRQFECQCPEGFTGAHCESVLIDQCSSSPCLHGGKCVASADNSTYTCLCLPGFAGNDCSQQMCSESTCINNGSCIYNSESASTACVCMAGYTGETCEVDLCQVVQCLNGGNCVFGKCVCQRNFTGQLCETNVCEQISCLHGLCSEGVCYCMTGFYGLTCELDINECDNHTFSGYCFNNGTCENTYGSYICRCPVEYTGTFCDTVSTGIISTYAMDESGFSGWGDIMLILEIVLFFAVLFTIVFGLTHTFRNLCISQVRRVFPCIISRCKKPFEMDHQFVNKLFGEKKVNVSVISSPAVHSSQHYVLL